MLWPSRRSCYTVSLNDNVISVVNGNQTEYILDLLLNEIASHDAFRETA